MTHNARSYLIIFGVAFVAIAAYVTTTNDIKSWSDLMSVKQFFGIGAIAVSTVINGFKTPPQKSEPAG